MRGKVTLSLIQSFFDAYEIIKTGVRSLQATRGADPTKDARLSIVLKKALRARDILEQVQQFEASEAELRKQYAAALRASSQLETEVPIPELSKMNDFATEEGLRTTMRKILGYGPTSEQSRKDPFGVFLGLRSGHILAPMTWEQYISKFHRINESAVMSPAVLEQLALFSRSRRMLLRELHVLAQGLAGEGVVLPQLSALSTSCAGFDEFMGQLQELRENHMAMLRRDLGSLDLRMVERKAKLQMGPDEYAQSELPPVIARMMPLYDKITREGYLPNSKEWHQFESDLDWLAGQLGTIQDTSVQAEACVQHHQRRLYERLAETGSKR